MYYDVYKSPLCDIIMIGDEQGLSMLYLATNEKKEPNPLEKDWIRKPEFFVEIKRQLEEYFAGKRQEFTVKLNLKGTEFQKKVWRELARIPYGRTRTYKEIAQAVGNEKACRAVGMANSRNPLPLIFPCHRVIGADGRLTGFASGLRIKEQLLNLEAGIVHEDLL